MFTKWIDLWRKNHGRLRPGLRARTIKRPIRRLLRVEPLETRVVPAIASATFVNGVVSIVCDNADDKVVVTTNANGAIRVNGLAVVGSPTARITSAITVNGGGGNDTLDLFGLSVFPAVRTLIGGPGNDTLLGSKGADVLNGGDGNDELTGSDGNDTLNGGAGNDVLSGGRGDDATNGGAGDDTYRFITNNPFVPGDSGTDTITEAANGGNDTLDFTNMAQAVNIDLAVSAQQAVAAATQNNEALALKLTNPAQIENVIGSENDDTILGNDAANEVNGLAGNDTIEGRAGDDKLFGGDGNDSIDGGAGNNVLFGGKDNDKFLFNNYVGTTADCFRCGQRFTLQANPGRVAWHIIAATLAVLVTIGGFTARIYFRAKRFEARHHAAQGAHRQSPATAADRDDD